MARPKAFTRRFFVKFYIQSYCAGKWYSIISESGEERFLVPEPDPIWPRILDLNGQLLEMFIMWSQFYSAHHVARPIISTSILLKLSVASFFFLNPFGSWFGLQASSSYIALTYFSSYPKLKKMTLLIRLQHVYFCPPDIWQSFCSKLQ